jgi:hypothetical protein
MVNLINYEIFVLGTKFSFFQKSLLLRRETSETPLSESS